MSPADHSGISVMVVVPTISIPQFMHTDINQFKLSTKSAFNIDSLLKHETGIYPTLKQYNKNSAMKFWKSKNTVYRSKNYFLIKKL